MEGVFNMLSFASYFKYGANTLFDSIFEKFFSQNWMSVFLCAPQKKTQYKESHVDDHNRGLFREARKLHKLWVKWLTT